MQMVPCRAGTRVLAAVGLVMALWANAAHAQVMVDGPHFDTATKGDWPGTYGQCYSVVPYNPNTTNTPEDKVGPFPSRTDNGAFYKVNGVDAQCVAGLPSFIGFVDFAVGTAGEPGHQGNEPAGEAFIWHYCEPKQPGEPDAPGSAPGKCRDGQSATWRVKPGVSQFNACLTQANNGQAVFYNGVWDSEAKAYEPMFFDLLIDRGGDAQIAYYFLEGAGECRNLDYRLIVNGKVESSGSIAQFDGGKYMVFNVKNLPGASDVRLELKLAANGGGFCNGAGDNSLLGGAFIGGDICGRVDIDIRKGDPQNAQEGVDKRTIGFGEPVAFGIVVKNTGDVTLTNVKVTDAQVPGCAKEIGTLAPNGVFTYVCNAPDASISYVNEACVAGTGNGRTVNDCDPSEIIVPPPCGLSVDKQCIVPIAPPPSSFTCSKPIDSLSMKWNGTQTVTIKAYKGAIGSTLLATVTDVEPGEIVTVNGYAGAPNDVEWEIVGIGKSQFHISCSDDDMDGPEDCGKAEGDGKRGGAGLNAWLFEGMSGGGKSFQCTTTPPTGSDSCVITPQRKASCETEGKPTSLTFLYNPAGCGGNNPQNGKYTCSGNVSGAISVSGGGYSYSPASNIQPGQTFTVTASKFSAQSAFVLKGTGSQTLGIHTSCSQDLAVGDVFGSLTLVGFNGKGTGNEVTYLYNITNTGPDLVDLILTDDKLGQIGTLDKLASQGSKQFRVTTTLSQTTTNVATVKGFFASPLAGPMCVDSDSVTVSVKPPDEPCGQCEGKVTELVLKWNGTGTPDVSATSKQSGKGGVVLKVEALGNNLFRITGNGGNKGFSGTLGTDITIKVNGHVHTTIHTSCSQPIGPGLVRGSFTVVSGRSKNGGILCPLTSQPDKCDHDDHDDDHDGKCDKDGKPSGHHDDDHDGKCDRDGKWRKRR